MSIASLAEAVRKELTTLGIPSVLEMAVLSTSGRVLYSDLGKTVMAKVSPFYESLQRMEQGDNLSLALDSTRTVVASKVSKKAVLIALTDKKVGIVLTKMGGVADKFGRLLDELIALEESTKEAAPPVQETAAAEGTITPPQSSVAEQSPPPAPPPAPPRSSRPQVSAVASPPVTAPSVATSPSVTLHKVTQRVIIPYLTDPKVLEKCPDKDRRFLELFDGTLSLNDIAKRIGVPFFDALQIANKYKNLRKADMKEVIRG